MAVTYHKFYSEVTSDMSIPAPALKLYTLLLDMSNIQTGETLPIYICQIAKKLNHSERTVQTWLAELIERGLIIRVFRKNKNNPRWNDSSYFIITHIRDANRRAEKGFETKTQKTSLPGASQLHPKREGFRESQNLTLKRGTEPELPSNSESFEPVSKALVPVIESAVRTEETQKPIDKTVNHDSLAVPEAIAESGTPREKPVDKAVNFDLSVVPEVMRHAAEYLLLKTGRPALTDNELRIIKEIEAKHTPERVMKEIDRQIEVKKRKGGNIRQVTFNLIGEILRDQASRVQSKSSRVVSVEAPTAARTVHQVTQALPDISVPILPVEEAESIISEYTPAKSEKKEAGISPERQELLERIKAHQDELTQELFRRHPQLCDTSPNAEFIDLSECDDSDLEFTVEDYLRLKFPEAAEEELQRREHCQGKDLEKAFDYDFTCAMCTNPETCPFNKKNGRAAVVLKEVLGGRKRLVTAWTMDIGCKHPDTGKETEKPNPEFERRLKGSGLTEWQSKQTFETYEHAGAKPEVVSAKAKAILAAKNQTSLVLAGKPGTGKTHLAIAIAIETMKGGRNAIFMTVPDLLDELARADWEHDDFFGLRQKFRDVSCLVLDDLGKEKGTPKKLEYLYQIINYRYSHGLQTIITTNAYNMNELVNNDNAKVIEPILSRVLQNGEWVTIREAENHRL